MIVCAHRSAPGRLCQPPPDGARCLDLDELVEEVLAAPLPPAALVDRLVDAKRHLQEVGRWAECLQVLHHPMVGLIEGTHALAEATPGHDPYDADLWLQRAAEPLDELAALGMLLRLEPNHGQALDGTTTLMLLDRCDDWRETHRGHAICAATALLQAVIRRREVAHAAA